MPNFQNFGVQTWRRPDIFRQKVIYLNSRQSEAQGLHGSHSFKLNLCSSERRHKKSCTVTSINSALLLLLLKQCSKQWPSSRSCASLCSSNKRLSFIMYINLTYLGNHGLGVFGFITIDIEIHWNRYEPYTQNKMSLNSLFYLKKNIDEPANNTIYHRRTHFLVWRHNSIEIFISHWNA